MAEAKSKDSWSHTSSILALIANVNRDPKKSRTFKPDDFNPCLPPAGRQAYTTKRKSGIGITSRNIH